MDKRARIQLQPTAILNTPFQTYDQDFTFIVNNEEFITSRIISDLLSPTICQLHLNDPTAESFIINTKNQGDFSFFLKLIKFQAQTLPENQIPFILEVLKILNNRSIQILMPELKTEITLDNVFDIIQQHEKNSQFYSSCFEKEVEFISSHFFELSENHIERASQLQIDTLHLILQNPHLQLKDENQLMCFVNHLYEQNPENYVFFEYVDFLYVEEAKISEFIDIFNIDDITTKIWRNISYRFKQRIEINDFALLRLESDRYIKRGQLFQCKNNNEFDGIINYLRQQSNGMIQNMINITASSLHRSSFSQYNVCLFEDRDKCFQTTNEPNSWICFDFKDHRIMPTNYIIKSSNHNQNGHQPKSWVIEASNDSVNWEILDEVNNCSYLNGQYLIHTFNMNKKIYKEFRLIRMRQTSHNWHGSDNYNYFTLGSIEFFGRLI